MCLKLNSKIPVQSLIAETDIRCYKVCFDRSTKFYTKYETFFRGDSVHLNTLYTSSFSIEYNNNEYVVERGLHSFTSATAALNFSGIKKYADRRRYKVAILRGIIPKGSSYFKGKFNRYGSYCSSGIIYTSVLVTNNEI